MTAKRPGAEPVTELTRRYVKCAAHRKEMFASRRAAQARLSWIQRHPDGYQGEAGGKLPTRVYLSPDCGFWHLTSKPAPPMVTQP